MEVKNSITDYTDVQIQKIEHLNRTIYDHVVQDGFLKVNSCNFNDFPAFIRIVVHHGNSNREIIAEIVAYLYDTYKMVAGRL